HRHRGGGAAPRRPGDHAGCGVRRPDGMACTPAGQGAGAPRGPGGAVRSGSAQPARGLVVPSSAVVTPASTRRLRPSPRKVLAIASLGAAVAFVDATIVNIALPSI